MSQNQLLTIPANTDQENQFVESFMEASRELVPSVQITLAKRIIRPGSNKVVCLAARTSIPLRDDEVASVSDLALRLSDGTNVALSLSFFNDALGGVGGEYSPLKRYVYDPSHYSKKNDSALGYVLTGMTCVFLAGIFAVGQRPFDALTQFSAMVKPAHVAAVAAAAPKAAAKPLTAYAAGSSVKFGPPATAAIKATTATPTKTTSSSTSSTSGKAKSASSHAKSAHAAGSRESHEQMLVPPPPPTPYVMPDGTAMQFMDPRSLTQSGFKDERAIRANNSEKLETAKPVKTQAKADVIKAAEPPALFETRQERQSVQEDLSTIEPKTYRTRDAAFWPTASAKQSAPAPGNDTTTMQLERIVPPVPAASTSEN